MALTLALYATSPHPPNPVYATSPTGRPDPNPQHLDRALSRAERDAAEREIDGEIKREIEREVDGEMAPMRPRSPSTMWLLFSDDDDLWHPRRAGWG